MILGGEIKIDPKKRQPYCSIRQNLGLRHSLIMILGAFGDYPTKRPMYDKRSKGRQEGKSLQGALQEVEIHRTGGKQRYGSQFVQIIKYIQ